MPYYVTARRRMIDRYYREERDHYVSDALSELEDAVMHFWEVQAKIGKAISICIQDGLGPKAGSPLYWEAFEYFNPSDKKAGGHWLLVDNRPNGGSWKPDPRVLEIISRLYPEDPVPHTWMKWWESQQPKP
jgi:hypothetical protein